MLSSIGILSFILGLALLLVSVIFMTLDILWEFAGFIFDIAIILIFSPIIITLLIFVISGFISLF